MFRVILRDLRFRRLFFKFEFLFLFYKSVILDVRLRLRWRLHMQSRLSQLCQFVSRASFKNYCLVTGHSRSIFRKFGLSRQMFHERVRLGMLEGVKKSSW